MATPSLEKIELTLFRLNEEPRTFSGYRHLLNEIGACTVRKSLCSKLYRARTGQFTVQDENYRTLTLHDFGPYMVGPYEDYRTVLYDIRNGPVENTGRPRGGHYFRRFATFAERRDNGAWRAEEGEPPPRASRMGHNLPCAWDDYSRSDWNVKSWKHYRKTQYRA